MAAQVSVEMEPLSEVSVGHRCSNNHACRLGDIYATTHLPTLEIQIDTVGGDKRVIENADTVRPQ